MKLDSPLFDSLRVKTGDDRTRRPAQNCCQWPGCNAPAAHRAPKGRQQEGQYWQFCFDHVKQYNQSYNYFAGMTDEAVCAYQKDALTGHRPTWRMGARGGGADGHGYEDEMHDPFAFGAEMGGTGFKPRREEPEGRVIRTLERQALEIMGLDLSADAAQIKARYKELVKLHHPDANGGDRSSEDRLRHVIEAYANLKQAGLC